MDDFASDFDGAWKEALDSFFREFLEFSFPGIARDVNWDREVESLDTELKRIIPESELGKGFVDKFVRLWTLSDKQEALFIHVEIQSQRDMNFAHRMYRYNHRLEDVYESMPVSVAVLGDAYHDWRPALHSAGRFGCRVEFHYPILKLADFVNREAELETHPSLFAPFVLAHLKTNETKGNPESRLVWKLRVVRGLYERGLDQVTIRRLFRVVDWVMTLPKFLAKTLYSQIQAIEKEKTVPFITSIEEYLLEKGEEQGLEKGRQEGRQEMQVDAIRLGLKLRFGQAGVDLMPRIRAVEEPAVLDAVYTAIESAPDLTAIRELLPPQA